MKRYLALAAAALLTVPTSVAAQQIVAPTSAVINSGGSGFGSINDTHNQNGLSTGYTSGVTNFDSYIASAPTHTIIFPGNEWFSDLGETSATVTYDLGSILGIDAFALWNEEFSGIGSFNLLTSTNGIDFVAALMGISPLNSPSDIDYSAQVFSFGATSARFARLEMSGCPQPNASGNYCSIGEVAFRTAAVTGAVPEPATWAMMLMGFGAMGAALRRRKRSTRLAQMA